MWFLRDETILDKGVRESNIIKICKENNIHIGYFFCKSKYMGLGIHDKDYALLMTKIDEFKLNKTK